MKQPLFSGQRLIATSSGLCSGLDAARGPGWAPTFLLAAGGALLLQQALAVERGQRRGRILLDP